VQEDNDGNVQTRTDSERAVEPEPVVNPTMVSPNCSSGGESTGIQTGLFYDVHDIAPFEIWLFSMFILVANAPGPVAKNTRSRRSNARKSRKSSSLREISDTDGSDTEETGKFILHLIYIHI